MITSSGLPHFGRGNSKLPDSFLTFALPSGFTCPGALSCLAKAHRITGKITDGPKQTFRCYEASVEALRPGVRHARWRNFELMRGLPALALAELLLAGIAAKRNLKTTHVRWFTGGDCFSPELRDAIVTCASETDDLTHYFYTKNLPLFLDNFFSSKPSNLFVTASWGGQHDLLIPNHFPRSARVCHTRSDAQLLGLPVDFNDSYAYQPLDTHFCHLTHGTQPSGSEASLAISARRRAGDFVGYGAKHVIAA